MKNLKSKINLVLLFTLLIPSFLLAEKNNISVIQGGVAVFPKNNEYTGWGKVLSYESIYRWGLSNSVYINRDTGPVVDNYAVYVGKDGSSLEFTDMKRYGPFYLFIDFVTYKGKSLGINSRLKIYIDGNLFDELNWAELGQMSYYSREIPREYYFDGAVKIEFREVDTVGGFWGIWDLALTDGKPPVGNKTEKYDFSPAIEKYISDRTEKMKKMTPGSKADGEFSIKTPDSPVEPSADK